MRWRVKEDRKREDRKKKKEKRRIDQRRDAESTKRRREPGNDAGNIEETQKKSEES